MKKLLAILLIALSFASCADSKQFEIDGKQVVVEPYGWFDETEANDSINYRVNTGNVVWSILLFETIIAPIVITGNELWEPVSKKEPKQ